VPLAAEAGSDAPAERIDSWPSQPSAEYSSSGSDAGSLPVASLAELASELPAGSYERQPARFRAATPPPPIPRQGVGLRRLPETDSTHVAEVSEVAPSKAASSAPVWIAAGALVGVAFILLAIGVLQFMDSAPAASENLADRTDTEPLASDPTPRAPHTDLAGVVAGRRPPKDEGKVPSSETKSAVTTHPVQWVEPPDDEPDPSVAARTPVLGPASPSFLPDWARLPVPDRIDGPFVVVRRVTESAEPLTVPTLHMALDRYIGGTIELADEGPLFVDDLRVAGESRLIRARSGFRPIVHIESSNLEAVRKQRAVFVLDRKNLTFDGIDLIVDVGDLSATQTALFACSGATLTMRNCSITVLNHHNTPFTLVRVEHDSSRPTRIRLERTLVRGRCGGVDTSAAALELVVDQSVILGGQGPLVRVGAVERAIDRRLILSQSILAGPGPIIELAKKPPDSRSKPLAIHAIGSVFGRLHGAGVASVISSSSSSDGAAIQIGWQGDKNLFAGWKGFFACGNDRTVTVPDLDSVRSTWNGADRESQEIRPPWPHAADLATTAPDELAPFVPNHESILRAVAQVRAGLFEKAVDKYPSPEIPQPVAWALERGVQSPAARARNRSTSAIAIREKDTRRPPLKTTQRSLPPGSDGGELTFDTAASPWNGDLGAFLRDQLTPGMKHVRVRVVGSGSHRFTPVRLAEGLRLEIRVEPFAAAEPPSWSPDTSATGSGLIELKGGALILSHVILRHDESSRLSHLIHIEEGHLVLSQCQITAPAPSGDFAGNLIAFGSISTRPYPDDPSRPLFASRVDRPVCRLDESVLITGGTALSAELGLGLVALTQCAVAAGVTGVELRPSRVARRRFDADLVLDSCTMTSERAIVRLGPWSGLAPGPDRPWLVTSRNCAFLAMYDRKARETVLLRADADALARGAVSWQASNDAADVDFFIAAGDGPPRQVRSRDVQLQWVHFWGYNHMNGRMTGPRGAGSAHSVRFWEKLRPGRVEPVDLILNPDYHPDRDRLTVGADLGRLGIRPRTSRNGRPRG
jgi:serine/threonine-protein kinase